MTVDATARVVLFNASAERLFGHNGADLLGRPVWPLLPPDLHAIYKRYLRQFGRSRARLPRGLIGLRALDGLGQEIVLQATARRIELPGRTYLTFTLRAANDEGQAQRELQWRTNLLQTIVSSSDDAIIGKTLEGIILTWNPGAERLLGYSAEEMLGQSVLRLIPPERAEEEPAILARIASGERVEHFETVRVCKDGRRIDVSVTISPWLDASGRIMGASKIARDITEQKRAQERLLRLSRMHAVLSDINSLIVRTRDRQALIDGSCRIAVEQGHFGAAWIGLIDVASATLSAAAWAGPDPARIAHELLTVGRPIGLSHGIVARAIAGRCAVVGSDGGPNADDEATQRRHVAKAFGYQAAIALPLIANGEVVGALELFASERDALDATEERELISEIAGDISFALEHIANEEKLLYLAYRDPLTGAANRALLQDRLQQAIRSAQRGDRKLALIVGDIKGFRQINQSLGRHGGDALLQEVARRLRQLVVEPDHLARLNADHFGMLVTDVKDVREVAHLVRQLLSEALDKAYEVHSSRLRVTMRLGIAMYPTDGADGESLFKNAEAAHRRAKSSGEAFVFYQPDMNARVAETLQLESKLKTALEKNEFVLHYQPKVDAATLELVGLEALLRWNDPQSGLVPPAKFIPLLEESGLIAQVGPWAIRRALSDHRDWAHCGLVVPRIAVNITALELGREDFIDTVRGCIGAETCDALDLEITETVLMHNVTEAIPKLQRLRDMGIRIAIDDFGTGYSSLGYLSRLPIQTVKIDLSFTRSMTTDADSMTIVSTIISLAHSLNLRVVAEGVETEEQARFLRLLRCDELQGYLFGRPVSAKEVAGILSSRQRDTNLRWRAAG